MALCFFQIAYRTAGSRFPGKLSELFLVLSDDVSAVEDDRDRDEAKGFQARGRGQKHQLDDDQMSVRSSGSKRQDVTTSAEKTQNRGRGGYKDKGSSKNKSSFGNKPSRGNFVKK